MSSTTVTVESDTGGSFYDRDMEMLANELKQWARKDIDIETESLYGKIRFTFVLHD